MPWYFFEKYKEEMHSKVWFVDTRGNMFGLFVRKLCGVGYFYGGLGRLIQHFHQPWGLNLRLTIQGSGVFYMEVLTLHMADVVNKELRMYRHVKYLKDLMFPESSATNGEPLDVVEPRPSNAMDVLDLVVVPGFNADELEEEGYNEANCIIELSDYQVNSSNVVM